METFLNFYNSDLTIRPHNISTFLLVLLIIFHRMFNQLVNTMQVQPGVIAVNQQIWRGGETSHTGGAICSIHCK